MDRLEDRRELFVEFRERGCLVSGVVPVPGSAAWWRDQEAIDRTPRSGPGRRAMPFERVISCAIELVDEVGPVEFSMRLLATRLNSSTATLYRHFSGKEEIFCHLVDFVLGEVVSLGSGSGSGSVERGGGGAATWKEAVARAATMLFRTLCAHPGVAPLFASGVPLGPQALKAREMMLATLRGGGFPLDLAVKAHAVIARHAIGIAGQFHPHAEGRRADADVGAYFAGLDVEAFPLTVSAAALVPVDLDVEFRFGLQLILDGLEQLLP